MSRFTQNHFMDSYTGQPRRFPAVAIAVVVFILCIMPGQLLIAKQFPAISGLAQINPSLVFLEIPIQLPIPIDLILVPGLFLLIYPVLILLYPSGRGIFNRRPLQRVMAAVTGLFTILCCILIGALIYFLVQDHLTPQVRNGINSLGIIADIHLSFPGHETIYLRGSMVLMVCFIIGLWICIRKLRKEPAGQLTREQRMTPYERMLQEKRLHEKQMKQNTRNMQQEGYQPFKNQTHSGIQQATIQPDHNQPGLCWNQPVMTLKPEAIYFMPR